MHVSHPVTAPKLRHASIEQQNIYTATTYSIRKSTGKNITKQTVAWRPTKTTVEEEVGIVKVCQIFFPPFSSLEFLYVTMTGWE